MRKAFDKLRFRVSLLSPAGEKALDSGADLVEAVVVSGGSDKPSVPVLESFWLEEGATIGDLKDGLKTKGYEGIVSIEIALEDLDQSYVADVVATAKTGKVVQTVKIVDSLAMTTLVPEGAGTGGSCPGGAESGYQTSEGKKIHQELSARKVIVQTKLSKFPVVVARKEIEQINREEDLEAKLAEHKALVPRDFTFVFWRSGDGPIHLQPVFKRTFQS